MNKIEWLRKLANYYPKLRVAYSYKDKAGNMIWSRHREMIELWSDSDGKKFLSKVNHRQILPWEIILDFDYFVTMEKLKEIIIELQTYGFHTIKAYHSGSKGYHVHIYYPDLNIYTREQRERFRERVILKFGADLMKKSDFCLIAIENCLHWRTGKLKRRIII